MNQRMSRRNMYVYLLVVMLCAGLMTGWAQKAQESKGKGKAVADPSAKKPGDKVGKDSLTGKWSGTYTRDGATNPLTLELVQNAKTVTGSLILDTGTLPVEKGAYDPAEKKLTFESGPSAEERYQVSGTLKGDTLTGQWKGAGQSGPFSVTRVKETSGL